MVEFDRMNSESFSSPVTTFRVNLQVISDINVLILLIMELCNR